MASKTTTAVVAYFVENSAAGDGSRATSSGSFGNSSSTVPRRSAIMISAAKSMKRRKLPPRWIDASKVQQTCEQLFSTRSPAHITTTTISNAADNEEDENDHSTATTPLSKDEVMFVLDTFDGSAVYEYLSKAGARVISPYVIKYCDEECPEPFATIPMRPHALFSQCMRGLVVTATSLPTQTRKALQARVMMMGGAYSSGLNSAVTLLVAGSVTTDKYRAAYRMKIPVVSAEWVERCWTTYQYDLVRADSPELLRRHALPVFHNLMITCSGVDITDRQAVRRQIEKHGGSYSPTLRFDALNTVLVLSAPAGEKYIYAKKKNIPRLRFKWVADSMSAGYALPFDDYNIDAGDVSVMAVDETVVVSTDRGGSGCNSSTNSSAASTATGTTQRLRSNLNNLRDLADLLDELTLAVTSSTAEQDNSNAAASSASFLDQAVIFAVGFDEHSTVAIRNAVRRCGALFVAEFKPRLVTHVIAGPGFSSGQPLYGRLLEANVEKVVTIDWLIAALKAAECVDYLQYRFQPTQSSSSATTTQRSGSSSRSNGTASTAERNGKRNKPDFLFSTQAEKLIQDFEDGQEGQGQQPQFNSTAATTPNCTASSSMANFRTLISTTPASVTVAKTVRTIEEVVAKKQAEVIDIIDDEEEEEAEKTGETVEEESSPELVEEIEMVKRKKKTTTTTTTAATKSAASKAKGRKASATASVSSASSTTSSRTSKRSKASVVSSVLGTGKAPASNFRPLTGAFESDEDGPVKWSPTTAAKMRAEALAAAKGGGRQQPTPSKLAQVRTSSKRLQKKLNEDEVEGIKEEEESLSPINRSSRKRTVRAISDDEEEEEEEEENEEEVHDSGAGLSNQPTLNLNNQRSATTTTTSNSNNLPTYSTYSAGVMSTYPDEEETSMEDDEEQQDEEEEGDEEQEEEDSIDDYIGDSIEDEEEEEEELGELTQPLGHSTIIERTSAAEEEEEEEVVEAPKSSAKPPSQRPPLLMLSGFTDDVRERLATDLEAKLGVAVHRSPTVLHPVTHLILREPYATEKTLSAIAAGVWLLVPAYVERSLEAGRLLPEADFDWSAQDLSSYSNSSSRRRLMLASAVWRRYITDRHAGSNGGGVFSGWRTLLVTRSACMDSMAKILEAGRAEVLWLEEQFKGASGASGKRVSSQAFERTLGELLATVRYAIFDRAVMTGEEGRSALATASAASTQRPTGTAATAPTTQAYPKELLSRLQFSRLLEAFAGRGRLLPQEALSRYLISAKPAEDEDGGDGGGGDVLGRCAVSPSQLKEVLKGLK